jgi:hypothetical protein
MMAQLSNASTMPSIDSLLRMLELVIAAVFFLFLVFFIWGVKKFWVLSIANKIIFGIWIVFAFSHMILIIFDLLGRSINWDWFFGLKIFELLFERFGVAMSVIFVYIGFPAILFMLLMILSSLKRNRG